MGELRDRARLAEEALDVLLVLAVVVVEDLQGDVAFEKRVERAVHARHTAAADDLLELVPVRDELLHSQRNLSFPALGNPN